MLNKLKLLLLVTILFSGVFLFNKVRVDNEIQPLSVKGAKQIATSSIIPGAWDCDYITYLNSTCSGNPIHNKAIMTGNHTDPLCSKVGDNYSRTVLCTPATSDSCTREGACSVNGIGCCDGSAPVKVSYCTGFTGHICPSASGQVGCGQPCSTNAECSIGLSCQDITGYKKCWASACSTGPTNRIRVQGNVVGCGGQPLSGVRVSMFADTTTSILNTTYTDTYGNYRITKGYKDTDGVRKFALAAGKDAKSTEVNYFSRRLAAPAFMSPYNLSYNCGVVNCNYRQNLAAGGPYRENYHLGGNWTQDQFKARVVHGTETAKGFDFKQVNCQ